MTSRDVTGPIKIVLAAALGLMLSGCMPGEPPRSIADFEADRSALDAKLVSCRADRRAAIEDVECQHARTAANRIAMAEDAERKARLEKDSQRQLDALRRQRNVADSQQQAREAALVASGESKLANGQPLTDAEARALGIDPENSVLTQSGSAGAVSVLPPVEQEQTDIPTPGTLPASVESADTPPENGDQPRSLSEIRESLNADREADDSDDTDE